MAEGVAEYVSKKDKTTYRVLVPENTCKKMDSTFPGKPMFVDHVPEVNPEIIEKLCVGYVVESFFNQMDGKHWAKFIITDDRGLDAIARKFVLSNCYDATSYAPGGRWHGMDFNKEVMDGEYEHLALVKEPRYRESIILEPEGFKKYNEAKKIELEKLQNSDDKKSKTKKQESSMLKIFKREKVQNNDVDFDTMEVELPKSKKTMTLSRLVNEADDKAMNGAYANMDSKVKCGDEEMTVNELAEKYNSLKKNADEAEKKANSEAAAKAEEEKKKNSEAAAKAEADKKANDEAAKKAEDEKKANDEAAKKAEDEKKANEEKEKLANADHFRRLSNAAAESQAGTATVHMSLKNQVDLGKKRYGSTK